ncbi:sensor histidine kinase [Desulforamulus ruminis]|uniref:ATP-binding region ATPase domain protein n=1 Tax=Desulforamulus ruminis (strain ATCC 23193 / DSM 2154 / NCIMB 8452 / DL) TaxID=696281 RepID=F6DRV0_DESRL|nr:GHKL domain-containing protein [Desulforamulus ruminis]AEG59861.1 ATP-binding region ATPase domain protein [Desulforamulus ruminis DSM 2154]
MQLLGLASLIIYDVFVLLYFKKMFPPKRSHWLFYLAAVAINIGIAIPSYLLLDHRFAVYLIMGSIMLAFHLLFYGNWLQILYAGSLYMFSLYSSRGIIFSIYAFVLHTSIKDVLQQETYYITIFALAVLLSILFSLFIRKVIVPDTSARHLLYNKEQLRFVVVYLFIQLVFLTLINDGRFHDEIRQSWLSSLYLISCIISKLWLLVLYHTTKVSELLEYELHTRQLQEQLSRQMRHYQSYRKFTESYRAFRHDYKSMMTSMKTLLYSQEYEKAARMLDDIHDTMQRDVLVHKAYSNNVLLDAILQDAANTCEEKSIRFSAVAHLPENISITDLDIVRIFSNVINNAIEACNKVSGPEPFIEITSSGNPDWATIEVSNSFNELLWKDGELETTKESKDFHGFGLRIIKETIEGLGGLIFIEADQEKRIFKIKLCIPKASP